MSKIDQKYIDALQNFTDALDAIVDVLQQQQKTGKADVVNELFKAPTNELTKVVKDLKKVTQKGFTDLKSDNAKILKKIDSIKQQKESGMFDKIEDGKNKNKIVDGIKVVILIAAGVLALGMAFKIIGKVDFLSVIALSAAMVAMAYTYKQIADIKGLTYFKVFMIALALPIMAMGLLASGWILRHFPVIGILQGLSMILVGASVGVAAYFLLRSISKINIKKDWATILLLPQILPLIATGLLSAAWILKNFPIFGLLQSLSLILISAALGIAAFLLLSGLGKIDIKKNWATILVLPMILPLIALGIVLASKVLQNYMPLKQPWKLLIDSLVLGLSVLFFTPSVLLLGMFIKDYKQLTIGILGAIAVAGAIVAIAEIFKLLPTTFVTPPLMWTLKTGLSLLMFSAVALLIAVVLGANLSFSYDTGKGISSVTGTAGGKFENLAVGVLGLIAVAGSIVAISHILTLFKPGPGIPMKWTMNVGLSMMIFSASLLLITILMNSTLSVNYDFGKNGKASLSGSIKGDLKTLGKGFLAMIGVSLTLVAISQILKFMDNSTRIDPEWSLNVGLTLLGFGTASFLIGIIVQKNVTALPYGLIAVVGIAAAILAVDFIIRQGQYKEYPKTDWMLGVGLAIVGFGAVATLIGLFGAAGLIAIGFGLAGILLIAGGILAVDFVIRQGKYQDYPKVEWMKGIGLAIVGFGAVATLIGLFGAAGLIAIGFGLAGILLIAGGILAVDVILRQGKYKDYPSEKWINGVGLTLLKFGALSSLLAPFIALIVIGSLSMLAISATILAVDVILKQGKYKDYPSEKWINGVGLTLLKFGALSVILAPFVVWIVAGSLSMLAISATIIAVDSILRQGKYKDHPTEKWINGVGLTLLKFGALSSLLAPFIVFIAIGSLSMLAMSKTIVEIDTILKQGKYKDYPSEKWINDVGLTLLKFGALSSLLAPFIALIVIGSISMLAIAGSIVEVDFILRQGQYKDYPKTDWIKGVGLAILGFTTMAVSLGVIIAGTLGVAALIGAAGIGAILAIVGAMVAVDFMLNQGTFTKFPSKEWVAGVDAALSVFSNIKLGGGGVIGTVGSLIKSSTGSYSSVAREIRDVSWILSAGKYGNYPSTQWITDVRISFKSYMMIMAQLEPLVPLFETMSVFVRNLSINMISIAVLLNSIDWNNMKTPSSLYMDNFQNFLVEIYETYTLIDASVNLLQFTLFSINASNSLFFTSIILNNGKYDNLPSREYIDNFAYFIVVISDTVRRANFDVVASLVFLHATMNVLPAINYWIQMISKGDFTKVPTFAYSDQFAYYVYVMGMVVKNWGPTVEQSVNFHSSIRFIVPAITSFTTIPLMDAKFTQSLDYIKQGLILTASGVYDFNSYGLSLKDFETFEFSMRFVSNAIDTFSKLPIVDMKFLSSMITMRLALSQLVGAVNSFLYEDYEVSLLFGAIKIKGKKKKDLSDYVSFSNFVRTIAFGLKTLGELKPIPENAINSFSKFLQYLDKMPKDVFNLNDKADGIKKLADSLMNLATSLNTLNKSLTGFLDMSKGLYLISIIDDAKLGNVLKSIEQHQSALRIVYKVPEEQASLLSVIKSLYETLPGTGVEATQNKEIAGKIEAKDTENKKQEQFYQDISEIKSLLYQFLEYSDRPQQGASVHK